MYNFFCAVVNSFFHGVLWYRLAVHWDGWVGGWVELLLHEMLTKLEIYIRSWGGNPIYLYRCTYV